MQNSSLQWRKFLLYYMSVLREVSADKFILLGMRPWRSWIARVTPTHKAAGSNPVGRTKTRQNLIILAGFPLSKLIFEELDG